MAVNEVNHLTDDYFIKGERHDSLVGERYASPGTRGKVSNGQIAQLAFSGARGGYPPVVVSQEDHWWFHRQT